MKKKTLILLLLGVLIIAGYFALKQKANINTQGEKLPHVTLRQGWFPWAGYAGEMVAINETDSLSGILIKVDPGADDIDPVKMVIGGNNDFGITSAEAIITANQKGAELVAIAVANYKSPTCFISLEGSKIRTPKDFEGKRVGILSGSETETVYRFLIHKLNISSSKISEVEAPYDLKTFINKSYDVYPGFIYAEPLALDLQKIKYTLIKPEDFGVKLIGAVYFTSKRMIIEHPKIVQAFVNSLAKGWENALTNPEKAISYLKIYDNSIDKEREKQTLIRGLDYFKGEQNKILFASDSSWNTLYNALLVIKKVKPGFNVSSCYNNSFINNYHKNK